MYFILTTMVVNELIQKLNTLGLSEYESRAYITLLKECPLTAYETAKNSGIPTSKIYEVLHKLNEKGMINEFSDDQKARYIPIDPEEFLNAYFANVKNTVNTLKTGLKEIHNEKDLSYIWNIRDYSFLMDKARSIIQNSKKTLLLSLWPQELEQLEEALTIAQKNNVKIALVHFGKTHSTIGMVFPHPIEDTIYTEHGGRGLVVIGDSEELLLGNMGENDVITGAATQNTGVIAMAEDYVKHDIYIMKLVNRFNDEMIAVYGDNYAKLRDIFSNEVNE